MQRASHALEFAFFAKICDQVHKHCMINVPVITAKAIELQKLCNAQIASEDMLMLGFSAGWLTEFKKRRGLCSFTCHRESGEADMTAITSTLPAILGSLSVVLEMCMILANAACSTSSLLIALLLSVFQKSKKR